jgi:dienelactone hydrolase
MRSKTLIQKIISNPVIQTFVIYVSGSWVVIELVEYFIAHFGLNEHVRNIILILLLCGMPVALILAWYLNSGKETAGEGPDIETSSAEITPSKKPRSKLARWLRRPGIYVPVIVLILLIIVAGIRYFDRRAKVRWANETAILEIEQLINEFKIPAAFQLVRKAGRYVSENPKFRELSSLVSTKITILTDPPGADIYFKEYADLAGDWKFLGATPLDSISMPIYAFYRWKMEKPGYETVLAAAPTGFPDGHDTLYRTLLRSGQIPPGMVYVEGRSKGTAGDFSSEKPGFFIDKFEITNKQFKEFIDKGGYQNPAYWKHEFVRDHVKLSRQEALDYFKDATGRNGPAGWHVGDYPDGQEDYPVTGISWYEAAAYAEFAGKDLPTSEDWTHAAGYDDYTYSYFAGSNLVPLSNFREMGPEPVGHDQAINYFGVNDMMGNAREWCWNRSPAGRIIRGGAWNDATYLSKDRSQLPAFDRSLKNGFRCVLYLDKDKIPEQAFQPVESNVQRNIKNEVPVPEAEFQIFKIQFQYDKTELNAKILGRNENADWVWEKAGFDAAYENERMIAYLFLPKNADPPYQTVIHFPGLYATDEKELLNSVNTTWYLDFFVKSGRAVVYPVYKGTYERNDGQYAGVKRGSHSYSEYLTKLVKDLSRTIDYLETRPDIDTGKLAYFGNSWGGRLGAIMLAVEGRIDLGMLQLAGFGTKAFPEAEELNYVTHVEVPVLMLNGRYDFTFPLETSVRPMFELLGTPAEHKALKIYETDHFIPRNELIKETLNWLDRYFGPVNKY